jgi:hypothetical protein
MSDWRDQPHTHGGTDCGGGADCPARGTPLHLEMVDPTPEDLAVNAVRFRVTSTAGAPGPWRATPGTLHVLPSKPDTPHQPPTPTRGETTEETEMTHSGEPPSPAELRAAWIALAKDQETRLLMTRENARALGARAADDPDSGPAAGEWRATTWAADQLLRAVRGLPAPVVPRDDTLGQATLEEALEPVCPSCGGKKGGGASGPCWDPGHRGPRGCAGRASSPLADR